jgi:L-ribulose-5-phosphate 4-epimerase
MVIVYIMPTIEVNEARSKTEGNRPLPPFSPELLDGIIRVGRNLSNRGLMPGSQGNISVRDPATGLMAITPHDFPYDVMTTDDLSILRVDTGAVVGGSRDPSFELDSHLTVMRERDDVNAVIHSEPTFVNALAATGREIVAVTTTGLKSAGGTVPVMPFSYRRDVAFARSMLEAMSGRHAVVWANHGLLVIGSSLHEASERTFGVEENARVLAVASLLGDPKTLEFVADVGMVVA